MDQALSLGRHRGADRPAQDPAGEPASPRSGRRGGHLRDAAQPSALGPTDAGVLARTSGASTRCRRASTIYRVLVRNNLIVPVPRKRKRESYVRWERDEPMELWQHDFISGVFLKSEAVSSRW